MKREIAFITGGTGGIGAAFARYFAANGYDLIITGKPGDPVYPCIKNLGSKYKVKVSIIPAELADEKDVSRIETMIMQNKRIAVLVNNAGFGLGGHFWKESTDNLESMIKVHINAPVRFIHAALPGMIERRQGIIISLSSISSFIPIPYDSMYSATKLFHNSLLQSLHISLTKTGIKTQVLCPGLVKTDFHNKKNIDTSPLKKGSFIPWMMPDKVVEISIRNLKKKDKVIVIPGVWNKLLRFIYKLLPDHLYYAIAFKYLN